MMSSPVVYWPLVLLTNIIYSFTSHSNTVAPT